MKILKSIICILCLFVLAACSDKTDDNKEIGAEKGLTNVEITIPAEFYEGEDINQAISDIEAEGREVTANEDGSLTIVLSKAEHKEMMEEMYTSVATSLDEMKTSSDFMSIKDVTYNDSFSEVTLIVDRETFENSFDRFATLAIGISGMMYQAYDGVDVADYHVAISIQDADTEEVFETIAYPDVLQEKTEE